MGEWRPYFLVGYKNVTASSTKTLEIDIGATEEFEAHAIRIVATSESFDIIKITDQGGTPHTNADSTTVLDGRLLFNTTENEYNIVELPEPWNLAPQTRLSFDITDTSGSANEVWILLIGKMRSV